MTLGATTGNIRSIIHAHLPRARVVLAGSHHYGEATGESDYDLLVISTWPVGRSKRKAIAKSLSEAEIPYDIHFIPSLLTLLKWKNVAGRDLDTGEPVRLRLTRKVRSEIFANRIKMAFYYYLEGRFVSASISLFRARAIRYARSDVDLFSLAGNLAMLERWRSEFDDDEYALYHKALSCRMRGEESSLDEKLLLALMNTMFLDRHGTLFQLQHNLQYYLRSWKAGRVRVLVNYNRSITRALRAFANGDVDESRKQLGRLVAVRDLERQLREYSLLSIFEMEGGGSQRGDTPESDATTKREAPPVGDPR